MFLELAVFNVLLRTNPVQSVEKTFQLTRADRDLLLKPEYDVQVSQLFSYLFTNFEIRCNIS